MVQICHDNILSPQQYWNCMVIGSQYATNCEINVACSLLNCNIVIWVQGVDQSGNTCYTKQEFIHSADGITLNLLLRNHHFQYLYPILFNQRHTNENMNDKTNIEQNSLQQCKVIRNTKKRRQKRFHVSSVWVFFFLFFLVLNFTQLRDGPFNFQGEGGRGWLWVFF